MAEPRFDMTTVGEAMLRLSVPAGRRLETTHTLDVAPGGAEANTAAALARLGRRCAWAGALPANPLGRLVANHLRAAGVDAGAIIWCPEGRLGTYYIEFAGPPRPSSVIYDRTDSCAARMTPEMLNWDLLLDSRAIHLTGITPALSSSARAVVTEACSRARDRGVAVSFDVNYRQLLWSEDEARAVLEPLIEDVALLFCSYNDARRVFGYDGPPEEVARELARQMRARYAVVSIGADGVVASNGEQIRREAAVPVQVVDRLGAGDALAAGVLHGWLDGNVARGLRYGTVLAALALSQHGDMVVTTPEEVEGLMEAAGGGLVR